MTPDHDDRITELQDRRLTLADLPKAALVRFLEAHGNLHIGEPATRGCSIAAVLADEALAVQNGFPRLLALSDAVT